MNLLSVIAESRRRGGFDPDAQSWFNAVVAAGSSISDSNKSAVSAFVAGCKADGIWTAIKASCLLCAADSLTGALVPLVGSAPTNSNFVSGDYSRTTGLIGNGSTKRINTNRSNSADPQNSRHVSVWVNTRHTSNALYACCATTVNGNGDTYMYQNSNGTINTAKISQLGTPDLLSGTNLVSGFYGVNRASSSAMTVRRSSSTVSITVASSAPVNENLQIYGTTGFYSNSRLTFYSIGESINMALLDARLTTLMAALT